MLRFLKHLCVFAVIMVACDVAVGAACRYLVSHAKGGETARKDYMATRTTEDILIFGSSRAEHHYDPDILEEQLAATAYNCGFDGCGIMIAYGFFHMSMCRYCPQVIIYDFTPGPDLDDKTFPGELRYYYHHEGIDSIFWAGDGTTRYKMLSHMYRYNTQFSQVLMDNIRPLRGNNKGFTTVYSHDEKDYIRPWEDTTDYRHPNRAKMFYLERLMKECAGTTLLVVAVSPAYENTHNEVLTPVRTLCEEYDVPFLNHYTDSAFNFTREYFNDVYHLNRRGATAYSHVIAEEIKALRERTAPAER